jgi:quercetin dioxygenase-like cupin family protein
MSNATRGGLRMLLDQQRLGSTEVAAGERFYPANYSSGEHEHQAIEIIYVLDGEFQHVVNGQVHVLGPGKLGYVKPGDKVQHKVGPKGPVKALMIWVPGTEGTRVAQGWANPSGR